MFEKYLKKNYAEMRPYVMDESMEFINVGEHDAANGSPKPGDMIARNPTNYADQWLVSKEFFDANYVKA